MSFLGTLDRSTRSPVVSAIASQSLLALLCPALRAPPSPSRPRRRALYTSHPVLPSHAQMDGFFIRALVQAGSCPQHAKYSSTSREPTPFITSHHKTRRKSCSTRPQTRSFATCTPARNIIRHAVDVTREELKSLIDFYNPPEYDPGKGNEDPAQAGDGETLPNEKLYRPWPLESPEDIKTSFRLQKLLKKKDPDHSKIFDLYQLLPYPRIPHLPLPVIRRLFNHLAIVERHDYPSRQRFLSILDDMLIANIPIILSEWTSALAFAGRGSRSGPITDTDVQAMLCLWKDMETDAGVLGNNVTMNVLFDTAVKAGKFDLADAFLRELEKRNLRTSRYLRTGIIIYAGIRQDGDAVRKAYADLVAAGEIVDTVVLNAVISALFRAREPAAAEAVFHRMKAMHAEKTAPPPPPPSWREAREAGLCLDSDSRRLAALRRAAEEDDEKMEELDAQQQALQNAAPVGPDATTYALVIRYHAQAAGNIDRVAELLAEMHAHSLSPDGLVFLPIIRGFNEFGGVLYSSWTADKLEVFYREFVAAVDEGRQGCYLSRAAVVLVLHAFAKTSPERTWAVWGELRGRWRPSEDEVEFMYRLLRQLVPKQWKQSIEAGKREAREGEKDTLEGL